MTRKSWIYTPEGKALEKGSDEYYEYLGNKNSCAAIIPDEGAFVSPIDNKEYSGRAGMREHNRRHNVVNNRDLKGLPTLTTHQEYKPDRAAIRGELINAARKLGHL